MKSVDSGSAEGEFLDSLVGTHAWQLVGEFADLVRDAGSEAERRAAARITARLTAWGVPYAVHRPELLISLPGHASFQLGRRDYEAKTPSMTPPTGAGGIRGDAVYVAGGRAQSVGELLGASGAAGEVTGKLVITDGFPLPALIADLEARGAIAVVCISLGERIHEAISSTVWGSPDLGSPRVGPGIPVVSINGPDGLAVLGQLAAGDVVATVTTESRQEWMKIPIVVAEVAGSVEPDRFVLLHGHLDSWHEGVGDNATGDAALLELARGLQANRGKLARSVRIAWWSGHSQGRYAGSTWYADAFALELQRDCICHINCDSPGCRDADAFEDVFWMAEMKALAANAITDVTGLTATGRRPSRAGDVSFNNIGVSTCFMLSSTIPADVRQARGLYTVGGCGGNTEWHTEADGLDVADADRLLRDIKVYGAATWRAANSTVHPLDFGATLRQLTDRLEELDGPLAPGPCLGGAVAART